MEHSSRECGFQQLWHMGSVVLVPKLYGTGSVVVGHRLHCSAVYGIFPDQGWNPCFLRWQADSLPLRHQGRPHSTPFIHCLITNFILKVVRFGDFQIDTKIWICGFGAKRKDWGKVKI